MTARPAETDPPTRMRRLPRDKHNRIIPWFVKVKEDGTPDHRLPHKDAIRDAYRFQLCWLCGQRRGRWATFPIGPMCTINRISGEPPSHHECAVYAAQVCPFLANPSMRRRTAGLPEERETIGGFMAERNPGVVVLWVTQSWHVSREFNGHLFRLGDPDRVEWYTRGAAASREAAAAALDSGCQFLRGYAEGPEEHADIDRRYSAAVPLLPIA